MDSVEQIEAAVPAAARTMRAAYERRFGELGINLNQALIIGRLDVAERHTLNQTDVARLTRIRKPLVGNAVDNLVAAGLVARKSDPNDGRAKLLSLTPAGESLAVEVDRTFGEIAAAVRRGTTAEQRRTLVTTLAVVCANLGDLAGDQD